MDELTIEYKSCDHDSNRARTSSEHINQRITTSATIGSTCKAVFLERSVSLMFCMTGGCMLKDELQSNVKHL
jgi:hypothetical protein